MQHANEIFGIFLTRTHSYKIKHTRVSPKTTFVILGSPLIFTYFYFIQYIFSLNYNKNMIYF